MSSSETPPSVQAPVADGAAVSAAGAAALDAEQTRRNVVGPLALAAVALALILFGVITTNEFATSSNLINVVEAASLTGIAALGMTFITTSGSFFSLSVQQTAAICSIFFALTLREGFVLPLAILAVLAIAVVIGLAQGVTIAAGANPIITTLGAGGALFGLAAAITNSETIQAETNVARWIGEDRPLGVPVQCYIFVGLAIIAMIVLAKTRYGRETQLVGANREAARASGLRVGFTIAMAFVISAVMAGVCGIIVASQFGQGTTNQFPGFNIDVIAAVLVGGTAVQGGDGSALRTAVGALSIALLQNLMVLRDYSFGVRTLVVGAAVLVGAVIYHRLRSSLR